VDEVVEALLFPFKMIWVAVKLFGRFLVGVYKVYVMVVDSCSPKVASFIHFTVFTTVGTAIAVVVIFFTEAAKTETFCWTCLLGL
jgi:hypothetical protein